MRQARRDLEAALHNCNGGLFDWACFAAQQAAEKALKALYQHHHAEGWGHVLSVLIEGLVSDEPDLSRYLVMGKRLDKFYIPTRYPTSLDRGAPADAYTREEAVEAIEYARQIVEFCQARCSA